MPPGARDDRLVSDDESESSSRAADRKRRSWCRWRPASSRCRPVSCCYPRRCRSGGPNPRERRDWRSIGQVLAVLHQVGHAHFGLDGPPGFFGPLPQDNRPVESNRWADFYRQRRLDPLPRAAVDSGHLPLRSPRGRPGPGRLLRAGAGRRVRRLPGGRPDRPGFRGPPGALAASGLPCRRRRRRRSPLRPPVPRPSSRRDPGLSVTPAALPGSPPVPDGAPRRVPARARSSQRQRPTRCLGVGAAVRPRARQRRG